jgi:two-component system, OmpR family, sensor histidine kinase KdpD
MVKVLFRTVLAAAGSLAIALLCSHLFHSNATIAAIFLLLGIVLEGAYASRAEAIAAAISATLCLDYLFIPPIGKIAIADPQDWIVLAVFMAVSIVATNLSARLRRQRDELAIRQTDRERLHALNRAILLSDGGGHQLHRLLVNKCMELFAFEEAALFENGSGEIYRSRQNGSITESDLRKAALGGAIETIGQTTTLPIALGNKIYGSFAFVGAPLSAGLLQSMGNTIAVGLAQAQAQEVANRAEAVRKSEEIKSVMIDSLAHELKTPLTAIEAAAEMLHAGRVSEEQRDDLINVVQQEAQRLRRLMGEAIHLARIEAKRFKLERQAVPVDALIRAAVDSLEPRTALHPIHLEIAETAPTVFADPELVAQLIKQLLDNAIKYSPAGKPITVSATEEGGLVSIAVRDEGQGLTELEQSRVFDKFYRAKRDQGAVPGTGMGLAIARGIAEAHGGAILVESRLGEGSRFTVTLPAASEPALAEIAKT